VQISLLAERGVVEYDEDFVGPSGKRWTEANIAEEIEDIGFEAEVVERSEVQKVELRIYGSVQNEWEVVSYRADDFRLDNAELLVDSIIDATTSLAGVHSASLPYPHTHLLFTHSPLLISLRSIVDSLAASFPQLSFLPISSQNDDQLASLQKHKETTLWKRTFVISAWFAVPVFIIGMMSMYLPRWLMGWTMWRVCTGIYLGDLVCLGLTIPVQFFLARRFYENAWRAVKHKSATM
jgi:Cu+-exporting ATPase